MRLIPLISGRGKGVRLMLTMGVGRSLGDYDLVHREDSSKQPKGKIFCEITYFCQIYIPICSNIFVSLSFS